MKLSRIFLPCLALLCISTSVFADTTWTGLGDGSSWSDAANWDDGVPAGNEVVTIGSGNLVMFAGNLPFGTTLNLDGTLSNNGMGALRLNGATVNVGSTGELAGAFWDLDESDVTYQSGADFSATDWENKDGNSSTFVLGATGFQTINAQNFRIGNGNVHNPGDISQATFAADLGSYTGGVGTFTLVSFANDTIDLTDTQFQTANLLIENAGSYQAFLQWNDVDSTAGAIELVITSAIPEPTAVTLIGLLGIGLMVRRRK